MEPGIFAEIKIIKLLLEQQKSMGNLLDKVVTEMEVLANIVETLAEKQTIIENQLTKLTQQSGYITGCESDLEKLTNRIKLQNLAVLKKLQLQNNHLKKLDAQ